MRALTYMARMHLQLLLLLLLPLLLLLLLMMISGTLSYIVMVIAKIKLHLAVQRPLVGRCGYVGQGKQRRREVRTGKDGVGGNKKGEEVKEEGLGGCSKRRSPVEGA